MANYNLTYLSLGAGVQSTALLVLSNLGLRNCPKADCAIFADTQDEPQWVYDHLGWLERWSKIPIHRVTAGALGRDIVDRLNGRKSRCAAIPGFTDTPDGAAPLQRQCTQDYKIVPIQRKARELMGLRFRQRASGRVLARSLIGISLDEFHRVRDSLHTRALFFIG